MSLRLRPFGSPLDVVAFSESFVLAQVNHEQLIQSTAATDITITLPNDMPRGFSCLIEQDGAGQVIFAGATGATLRHYLSHDRTADQYAVALIYVSKNTNGRNAEYVLSGATATA